MCKECETELELPAACPCCLNYNCIEHIEEDTCVDAEGTYENHVLRCKICGRKTLSMDTLEDAIDAWNATDVDLITFDDDDTILISMNDLHRVYAFFGTDQCRSDKKCIYCKKVMELRAF